MRMYRISALLMALFSASVFTKALADDDTCSEASGSVSCVAGDASDFIYQASDGWVSGTGTDAGTAIAN